MHKSNIFCNCQICNLCNCDICSKKLYPNKSDNIYNILDSFLNDSINEDLLNISVEQTTYTIDDEEKLVKNSNSENEDINKVKDISRITVGTYVQPNITVVKVNSEYFNNTKSEDTVIQNESNLVISSTTSSIQSKTSHVKNESSTISNNESINKNGSVQLLGRGQVLSPSLQ